MNKEEINCVYSANGITTMSTKQYDNYIKIINDLKKENKILRENAEHKDKVFDKAIERIQYEEMFDDDNDHLVNFKEELKYILLKGDSE